MTVGRHPMAHERERLRRMNVVPAGELAGRRDNSPVRVAGCVITRQRPETAKGFAFLSLEDETGVSNVIVAPGLFEKRKQEVLGYPYLMISGILQNQEGAISVKAQGVTPLHLDAPRGRSHDFH